MKRPRRSNAVVYALYTNAALLLAILVAVMSRGSGSGLPVAFAEPAPIAGGSGVYLMPGQFSLNTYGCYILDTDAQTLCAYKFDGANTTLKLIAARNFRYDRRLSNFNTGSPKPEEVRKWLELEKDGGRGLEHNAIPAPQPRDVRE